MIFQCMATYVTFIQVPNYFWHAISRLRAVSLFSSVSHARERASSEAREMRAAAREEKREPLFFPAFPVSRLQLRTCAFSRVLFDGIRKKRDCS